VLDGTGALVGGVYPSRARSPAVSSRQAPTARSPSASAPTCVRSSRSTGWPTGASIRRNLALAAVAEHHHGAAGRRAGAQRAGRPVVELDARLQRAAGRARQRAALAPDAVGLGVAVARMGQPLRQRAVGRQQQQALGVAVEAPHRVQARERRQQVEHRAAAALVGGRRHHAGGLVQGEGAVARDRRDRRAVEGTRAPGPTLWPRWAVSPSTFTRPATISASALRRLATPARAR
jgi:hypothetical protein